ncbi:MAG: LysM peptidoglycan-binding domain-containing protein [Alphaproteobacteria bacterium]|nr:LysM peptidoglycan-binding domain-containing protein [Alphaproteobacteria bacterium]
MARLVVIFAILSLITIAMYWLAHHPATHSDVVATLPVQPAQHTSSTASTAAPASAPVGTADAPSTSDEAQASSEDAKSAPDAEATPSVPPLPTAGTEATVLQSTTTAAPAAKTGLVVEDVQPSKGNSIELRGRADPGATVKVSVNGQAAGAAIVGGDGAWFATVDKGKDESEPKIVLELVGADGTVLDKTNFVFKAALAAPPLSPQDQSLIAAQTSARSKPAKVHRPARRHRHTTLRVRRGQSLWRIARRQLGSGRKWRQIYEANKDRIGDDPDFIRPGTRLVLPG